MILVEQGQSPLILCLPHSGSDVPKAVNTRLNATGRLQADLAWRLERVFDFHKDLDMTVIRSSVSRYVIDLDKDPSTYANAPTDTAGSLCPALTLDGKRIYQDGEEPGPTEAEQRVLLFHQPFHKALLSQIDRLTRIHGRVVILDCQSMRSQIKGVTDKGLPLVNIGSLDGASCNRDLRNLFVGSFNGLEGFTIGVDEQTRGGFIAQCYGRPGQGLHCMTFLLAQRAYLRHESPPFEPDKTRIARLQSVLKDSFSRVIDWASVGAKPQAVATISAQPDTFGQAAGQAEVDAPAPVNETTDQTATVPDPQAEVDAGAEHEIIPVDPMTLPKLPKATDAPANKNLPLQVAE
ncbi:N-formylglutamate amidohydrolase [Roseibium sp. MMSF_3544]|uniref:N-formylglutamate amidohydrolase n=1 Tax=unclassified Roseibium TaxID=2629323 RepID=UPI00273F617C|nr:N-formylglutamate amidohydrolase [Roseibium sp. MMSF_3544]